jgi:uroporphyrin-3 C-methyltransferase/uroporphyrinogen III methyltransferase/synthase
MNDTPKPTPDNATQKLPEELSVDAAATGKNAKGTKKALRARGIGSFNLTNVGLAVLFVLLVAQWWSSTNQINQVREELARRLQASDVSNVETKSIAKSMLEMDKELQVKLGILENKQAESESHALALQQLYQDLSKNRDDWALSEIEQVLSTASQQLQLAGNVQGALIALQNADARLARSDKPQFITIRRSIAHDIDRLKTLPNLDLPGIALRLDSAIAQVDSMPLLVDENAVAITNPANPTNPTTARMPTRDLAKSDSSNKNTATQESNAGETQVLGITASWKLWLKEHWQSWSSEMGEELRQLVRIRNVENPEALLLAPDQGYFAKENVKLRLLNARLALLSRNEAAFKSDIMAAQKEITHYFDPRAKKTQAVLAVLRQIQNSKVSIEMPSLAESLNAVRNFTAKQ